MNALYRETISLLFSIFIILLALMVINEFVLPLVWAGIIAIASWPIYHRWLQLCRGQGMIASFTLVTLLTLTVALPFLWLTFIVTNELQILAKYLIEVNKQGITFPEWMMYIPHAEYIKIQWMQTLGKPQGLASLMTRTTHLSITPFTGIIKSFGSEVIHRSVAFGFTLMCLFFFYKDGLHIIHHVNAMGGYFLGDRWEPYRDNLPMAIKATINGLVLVGLGIGLTMGMIYWSVGIPAPAVFGAITGVLAMIPFAVIFAFMIVMILLLIEGKLIAAISVVVIGAAVMFIADHFVRPGIIGGSTRLPFLAVLFGILGGVKLFGVVGLFIGPIVMVLFITLWHEADCIPER